MGLNNIILFIVISATNIFDIKLYNLCLVGTDETVDVNTIERVNLV